MEDGGGRSRGEGDRRSEEGRERENRGTQLREPVWYTI